MQGDYTGILARMYKKCTEFFRMYKNVHSLKCTKKCTLENNIVNLSITYILYNNSVQQNLFYMYYLQYVKLHVVVVVAIVITQKSRLILVNMEIGYILLNLLKYDIQRGQIKIFIIVSHYLILLYYKILKILYILFSISGCIANVLKFMEI